MTKEEMINDLLRYEGSSPCPEDFDKYWDDALLEMNSVECDAQFVPKKFSSKIADMYDLFYTGTKGARIHARVAVPKNIEKKVPAVLMFHGLSCSASDWTELLIYASQGYVVAFMDARGQAGLSEDVGGAKGTTFSTPFTRGLGDVKENLLMRDVFLDTALLAKIVMNLEYVDETRVAVTGGSQGGALSVACACLVPEIKKCAIYYPYLSDYRKVYDMQLDKDAYEGMNYYLRNADPTHENLDEMFEKLAYIDIQNLANRMKAELLMFTGLRDTSCHPYTQFAMYNKVKSKKNVIFYPEYGHEYLKGAPDTIFEFFNDL